LARGGTFVDSYEEGWDQHLKEVNEDFEMFLVVDANLSRF
jgi:hypothetical protein